MFKDNKQVKPERVACDVCLKEVPKSEAMSPDATEYMVHFCGLDCYEKWKNTKEKRHN
jgi:hypothetical protein